MAIFMASLQIAIIIDLICAGCKVHGRRQPSIRSRPRIKFLGTGLPAQEMFA
jgi:hypothetical protein